MTMSKPLLDFVRAMTRLRDTLGAIPICESRDIEEGKPAFSEKHKPQYVTN